MLNFTEIVNGYSSAWHRSNYSNVTQKWPLVRSEQARKRETHSLTNRMLKKQIPNVKHLKKLSQQRFACQQDALQAT